MGHPHFTKDEIVRRGQEIYEREIRPRVEPEHEGEYLAVDIETGHYEIDPDVMEAAKRVQAAHPDGSRYLLRIGYPAFITLGGTILKSKQ